MYYKTTELPKIRAKSAYTEVFMANGYIYLSYPAGQIIPDGLTEFTEEEWFANKPEEPEEPEESEPSTTYTQSEVNEAVIALAEVL